MDNIKLTNTQLEKEKLRCKGLISGHDLTFAYSDDHAAYERGRDQYDEIRKILTELPEWMQQECREHWNHNVHKKIAADFIDDWLWEVD